MQIIRSSKSLYTEAENLIRSVAKAACPVNPTPTHPIIQRSVRWNEICWVRILLVMITRLVPHPFSKIPGPVPISIGSQLERRSRFNRCGLGSRRAVTHIRRIRCCSCRWILWLRRRQQPSWRRHRWLFWNQTDPCRLSRSWLISAIPNCCLRRNRKIQVFPFSFDSLQDCILFASPPRVVLCHVVLPSSDVDILIETPLQVVVPFIFVQPSQVEFNETLVLLGKGENRDIIEVCLANSSHKISQCEKLLMPKHHPVWSMPILELFMQKSVWHCNETDLGDMSTLILVDPFHRASPQSPLTCSTLDAG